MKVQGLLLIDWGEYYVADDEMSSNDEQSSLSSCEEAEEIGDEELDSEEEQALSLVLVGIPREQSEMNYDQLDSNVDASNPTLMGMPDIILEKIFHYSTEMASEVCVLERVCKRIRRLTTNEKFWTRHPIHHHYSFGPTPRKRAFICEGLRNIRYYKNGTANAILDVLRDEGGCVADTFRTLSADILSRMNHLGPEAHFRLRGDTIGYICELLQGYMIDRLEGAIYLAVHKVLGAVEDVSKAVQRDDMALAFRKQRDAFSFPSSFSSRGLTDSLLDSSSSSSSGINWKWPGDNCHEVLPPEAGRRIIRRLAYQACIPEMSNEAFILAEAELLHALGALLVSAYESSVEKAKTTQLLDEEDDLAYDVPTVSVDMFKTPPPSFQNEKEVVYTIVPGQIRTAAEQRGITPYKVYGDVWVASSGFTKDEEEDIERSYYYQSISSSDDDEEDDEEDSEESCSDIEEKAEKERAYYSIDSTWSECSSVEDSELDMDDYDEDSYLAEYHHGGDEIVAHYNHFPPNANNEEDDEDSDENDSDEDMADDIDYAVLE